VAYEAKVLKHSISERGVELITFEVNYPHAVHKDVMTHRWARNFQSFRAIPPELLLERLADDPFIPEVFGHRTKGMGQRNEPVKGQDAIDQALASEIWLQHVEDCIGKAKRFLSLGIAKQQVNFLIQDLCWIRGIITTTMPQLDNFYGLRLAEDENGDPVARPEVYKIAKMMQNADAESVPQSVGEGAWHLPLVTDDEIHEDYPKYDPDDLDNWVRHWEYWRKVSVGRCARVSYLTHDGSRDPDKDVALHDSLLYNGHMSPFEHQGSPIVIPGYWEDDDFTDRIMTRDTGCFGYGWTQYRKLIPGESNYAELQKLHVLSNPQ
jgi:hypothetical protein